MSYVIRPLSSRCAPQKLPLRGWRAQRDRGGLDASRHAPTWASLVVLLVGMLLGAAFVVPLLTPNAANAVTTYTRSVSCAGGSFLPVDSDTTYEMNGIRGCDRARTERGLFRCDPGLPHGGVVTQVRFTLVDNSLTAYVGPCWLKRHSPPGRRFDPRAGHGIGVQHHRFTRDVVRSADSSIDFALWTPASTPTSSSAR